MRRRGGGVVPAGVEILMASGPSDRIAEEQSALRRVATLVAGGAPPEEVYAAVTAEVGQVLSVDITVLDRYEPEGGVTVVGAWSGTGAARRIPVGLRLAGGGRNLHTLVLQTGRPARIENYAEATGAAADIAREHGIHSAVGAPISVEGRLWGVMSAVSARDEPLPADTEARLAGFTELVGTAIANAQVRLELRGFAEEQAALRRVATLVARAAPAEEVFAAVATEVGRLLRVGFTILSRYEPEGGAQVSVGAWTGADKPVPFPVGTRVRLGGRNVVSLVVETGRPARIEDYATASGQVADSARGWGLRSALGVPISVEGRLWGVISVGSTSEESLPPDTEARLGGFTELVGTAIANAQARVELRGFADEQAALRRVATLVARAAAPEDVFAAVAAEVGQMLSADIANLGRYDAGAAATIVGTWPEARAGNPYSLGMQVELGGANTASMVFETGRPARINVADASGAVAEAGRARGIHSSLAAPISVDGRLWGVMAVLYAREELLPSDTEARLAGFTELVGTAVANAEARAALTASRARIVAAADATRRRIERDLHDSAQQRLVSLALYLRTTVQAAVPPGADELAAQVNEVAEDIVGVVDELRELARGLHPAVLADGGLRPALKTLARRSAVPVRLDLHIDRRLPDPIELAAYYVVAEALANTVKHAQATSIEIHAAAGDGVLRVRVRDDGRGGADPSGGSGLIGLTDRVEALGGRLTLDSPPAAGTTMQVALPLTE
jgi:signal transduction histidine kinase